MGGGRQDGDDGARDEGTEARSAVAGFVEQAAVLTAATSRRSRALDEDLLDELAARIAELPEPVAAAATSVEVARAEGDGTGVRKRLFELGVAVVRYAVSVGLALAAEALKEQQASRPLGKALQRAARLSDGAWCELGRTVASQLEGAYGRRPEAFAFLRGKPLAELIRARNDFVHGGGSGDDAPELTLALLDEAQSLLGWPLRAVVALDPPSYQQRMGVPLRPGVWRKVRKPVAAGVQEGKLYVVHDAADGQRWSPAAPWIPEEERRLLLVDCPHSSGGSWRWFDPETGEHRECAELDAALKLLAGSDADAPVPPCERPALVGRSQAIAVMRRAADLTQAGGIGVVVLTGPAGIGRGRMLETIREAASGFGFGHVIDGACLEQRRGVLRPLRRAMGSSEGLEAVRAALQQAAAGDALRGSEALEAAVEAVEEALIEVSLQEPVLLLLDDAQWADEPTLSLLGLLTERATRKAQGRLLVVVAVRDERHPPGALTTFIGQVERDVGPGATRLALDPLSTTESTELLTGVAPLSEPLRQLLVDGAAGVPFFLVQSVLAWGETGALEWRKGAWHPVEEEVLQRAVPGVAEVVQARLVSTFEPGSEVERVAQQVLATVGWAGGALPLPQLLATMDALGVPVPLAEQALEALVETDLLAGTGQQPEYGFAQPMVRAAVVGSLGQKPWLPRLRRGLLEQLGKGEAADEDAAFIAEGYLELGDAASGARWLRRAVDHSIAMGLFRQAKEQADRLAEIAVDRDTQQEAGLYAVDALLRGGDAHAAKERYQSARLGASTDPARAVRARILAVSLAHALGESTDDVDGKLVADADALGDARLVIEARLAVATVLRAQRGLELVEEAIARLPDGAHGDLRYRVWMARFELLWDMGSANAPDCRHALEQSSEAARELGSRWALLDAENDSAVMDSAVGEASRAIASFKRIAAEAQRLHFGTLRRKALINTATTFSRSGNPQAAAGAARSAGEAARHAGDTGLLAIAQSVAADALRQVGQLDEAREAIDEAVALKLGAADANVAIALLRQADILVACGERAAATAAAALALEHARQVGNRDQAARAGLWLALHRFDDGSDGARAELEAIVDELRAKRDSLRAPTQRLLEQADERLGS